MTFKEIMFDILLPFLGGLGLFLYGMKMLSDNLEKTAGSKLRKMMDIMTSNRFAGVTVGAVFTMAIQSSSATTVMVVGFVNAGLMTLMQAAGVILGADIGTTITSQLIAFKLTDIAPLFLFTGVAMMFFVKKNKRAANIGAAIAGFGILFVGMSMMSSGLKPLAEMDQFTNILVLFENPLLGLLAGAFLTGVIQSSSASMGILLAMSMQGLVTLEGSIFIILGFNIGTCITALLACIGTNKMAKRAATLHLLFKIIGATIFIVLLQFLPITRWIAALTNDTTRQLAHFHTLFNLVMVAIMLPAMKYIVWLANKFIPGEDLVTSPLKLMYIEDHMFVSPAMAVTQIVKEVERMGNMALENIKNAVLAFKNNSPGLVKSVYNHEEVIDYLNHEISKSLVQANQLEISEKDSLLTGALFHVVNDLERIGDHAENIAEFAENRIEKPIKYSEEAIGELDEMSSRVFNLLVIALEIFHDNDIERANLVIPPLEQEIDDMERALRKRHIKRLKKQQCSARAGTIFIDILSNLERVADHSTNIAYSILEDS
ncbi:MAG: Na/Pi cotransporter family protein [Clostridiales bacterium]|nr:Na/Pi cotransporter family protein [Clostridiales bacterium]